MRKRVGRGDAHPPLFAGPSEAVTDVARSKLRVAPVREALTRGRETAGELVLCIDAPLATILRVIHAVEKREAPELRALVGIVGDVRHDAITPLFR